MKKYKAIPLFGLLEYDTTDTPGNGTDIGGDTNTGTSSGSGSTDTSSGDSSTNNTDTSNDSIDSPTSKDSSLSTFQKYALIIGSIIGLTLLVLNIPTIVKSSKKK